jgi:RNA polymerase sigma-32 factor
VSPLVDTLEATNDRPDVSTEDREFYDLLSRKLREFERTLRDKHELVLFRERLVAEKPLTFKELEEKYKLSNWKIRTVEKTLLSRLREHLDFIH